MKKQLRVIVFSMLFLLTGCNTQRNEKIATTTDAVKGEAVTDINKLKEDRFYVFSDDKYYPVYMKNSSFDTDEGDTASSQDDSRSLYFNEDWDNIPTLSYGDSLIYYTSDNLDEKFILERFEDFGYTLGLSNLERLESGRYAFSAEEKSEDSDKNRNINPDSDVKQLFELGRSQVIIDNIGGAKLRSGNISRGGTIIGLEKDRYYSTDIYVGSKLKNYILKADTRILTSMEAETITDYTFLRSRILKINIPEYYNNGYYMINGQGIFRYVKGKTYTEKTDFNIPNKIPEKEEEKKKEVAKNLTETNNLIEEPFTINEETDVVINFNYGETNGSYELADPIVKAIGTDSAYTFSKDDENLLTLKAKLRAGRYVLQITGLNGRTYSYQVYKDN